MTKKPWDYPSDLTAERLTLIARLIIQGRKDALDRHDTSIGDDAWTLGCKAFAYGKFRIVEADETDTHPWLRIVDSSMQFVFTIGAVPVRFYHGTADEPNQRTLRQSFPELRQLDLGFESEDEGRDLAYRFAVETDIDGSVLRVIFVGLRGEDSVLNWEVPISAEVRTLHIARSEPAPGVELPPPSVQAPGDEEEHDADSQ